jgi:hypothetical protein
MSETANRERQVPESAAACQQVKPCGWWKAAHPGSGKSPESLSQVLQKLDSPVYVTSDNGKQVFTNYGIAQLGTAQGEDRALALIATAPALKPVQ